MIGIKTCMFSLIDIFTSAYDVTITNERRDQGAKNNHYKMNKKYWFAHLNLFEWQLKVLMFL